MASHFHMDFKFLSTPPPASNRFRARCVPSLMSKSGLKSETCREVLVRSSGYPIFPGVTTDLSFGLEENRGNYDPLCAR